MSRTFSSIEFAVERLQQGRMIILVDDEDRENEGDLVFAAEYVTPEAINFMATHARGLICLSMAPEKIEKLKLPMMTQKNGSPYGTAFTTSIEAATGVTTGISACDRARTIAVASAADVQPSDIITPGHVFPLKARPNGVLERTGQTEGSVDLMRLAGLEPAAVICEIINEDGTMSRRDDLFIFSEQHDIPVITVKDLVDYRIRNETLISPLAQSRIPTEAYGDFEMTVFANKLDGSDHFSMTRMPFAAEQAPLVRIHSECITGDLFGSCKCDCGGQLKQSLSMLSEQGGILIYLRQEGRGIGLVNKIRAYNLQEQGMDTVDANLELGLPADQRDYAIAYQILKHFGISQVRLMTNNPEKIQSLEHYGIKVLDRIPLEIEPNEENLQYMQTKRKKMGHLIELTKGQHETH